MSKERAEDSVSVLSGKEIILSLSTQSTSSTSPKTKRAHHNDGRKIKKLAAIFTFKEGLLEARLTS